MNINDREVLPLLEQVVKGEKRWALFGFAPKTNELRAVSTGTGDMHEMAEEMSDGRAMFGYCREDVADKIRKYVLVAWCGEGVAPGTKALFQRLLADLQTFLQRSGFAVSCTIGVKSAQELSQELLMQKWRLSDTNR